MKRSSKGLVYKAMSVMITAVMLLSAVMTGSYAWQAATNKENEFSGTQASDYAAVLLKYEREADGGESENPISDTVFYLYKLASGERTQVGGRYLTDSTGKVEVQGLTAGEYVFVEPQPKYGYAYDKDDDGNDIREYHFTVNKDTPDKEVVIKAYNRRVSGGLEITKTVVNADGTALTEAQKDIPFEFTVKIGGDTETFTLKHGESKIYTGIPVGTMYTVIEKPVPHYTISSNNHQGNISKNDAKSDFVNTYYDNPPDPADTTLTVRKITIGDGADLEKDFEFTVFIDGKKHEFTLRHEQEKVFVLPVGAVYEVYEKDYSDEWYEQSAIENGFGTATPQAVVAKKTNRYVGETMIDISGEKTWEHGSNVNKPDSITIYLMNGDAVAETAEVVPDENGDWYYSFNVPQNDADGNAILYTIKEEPVPGYVSEVVGFDIRNVYIDPAEYAPVVRKIIVGDTPEVAAEFTFMLLALDNAPMPEHNTIKVTGAGEGVFGKITYFEAGTYRYTVTEVNGGEQGYDYDERVYTLTVVVEQKGAGFAVKSAVYTLAGVDSDAGKAEFINTYAERIPDTTSIKVTKRWVGSNPNQPESIQVRLLRNGEVYGELVTLSKENNWTHTWTGLEMEVQWTVDEPEVPDRYTKDISGNAINGYIIRNIFDTLPPEKVIISGAKTWVHGDNPAANHPSSIVIFIKNGNSVVIQQTITEADDWKWAFELPKHDENGNEIEYVIDEATVYGYVKMVDRHSLINTYVPPVPPPNPDPDPDPNSPTPQTNDTSNMTLWFVVMIASAFFLRWTLGRIKLVR